MDMIVESTTAHLLAQIRAGADVVQLFDSWAGVLTGQDFARWVIEPNKAIITQLTQHAPHVPVIGFPRKARGEDLTAYCVQTGIQGVGIDEGRRYGSHRLILRKKLYYLSKKWPLHVAISAIFLKEKFGYL